MVDDVSVEETHHFWYSGTAGRHVYQLQQFNNISVSPKAAAEHLAWAKDMRIEAP